LQLVERSCTPQKGENGVAFAVLRVGYKSLSQSLFYGLLQGSMDLNRAPGGLAQNIYNV
jgi:hypothetical protein